MRSAQNPAVHQGSAHSSLLLRCLGQSASERPLGPVRVDAAACDPKSATEPRVEDSVSVDVRSLPRSKCVAQTRLRKSTETLLARPLVSGRSEANLSSEDVAAVIRLIRFRGLSCCCRRFSAFRIEDCTAAFLLLLLGFANAGFRLFSFWPSDNLSLTILGFKIGL